MNTAAPSPAGIPRSAGRRNSGFTLLEVMVAIVVLSIIMTTAYGALRLGSLSWEAGVSRTLESGDLRTATGFLQRHISQALAMNWTGGSEERISFQGDVNSLRFVAPAPLQREDAGLFEYTLSLDTDDQSRQLVLAYMPYNPGGEDFQDPDADNRLVLAADIAEAEFDYYGVNTVTGAVAVNAAAAWHGNWPAEAMQLPQLVRIRVTSDSADRQWPELVIPVHAQISHEPA